MADYSDVNSILNVCAVDLGLVPTASDDVIADSGTNQNLLQLMTSLNFVGSNLRTAKAWTQLGQEALVTTVDGQEAYDLPTDFLLYRDNTGWNRTTQFPLLGPLSDEQWQAMKAQMGTILVQTAFRLWKGKLYLYPTPSAGNSIYFEYSSTYWVAAADGPSQPSKSSFDSGTDVVWYDTPLIVAATKLHFMQRKGFATEDIQGQLVVAMAGSAGGDGAGPRLNIAGKVLDVWGRYIDSMNVPPTGFGQ